MDIAVIYCITSLREQTFLSNYCIISRTPTLPSPSPIHSRNIAIEAAATNAEFTVLPKHQPPGASTNAKTFLTPLSTKCQHHRQVYCAPKKTHCNNCTVHDISLTHDRHFGGTCSLSHSIDGDTFVISRHLLCDSSHLKSADFSISKHLDLEGGSHLSLISDGENKS